jgi:hypothetical protein
LIVGQFLYLLTVRAQLLFPFLSLAFVSVAHGQGQPLTGDDLAKFLGPVSPDLIEWSRSQAIDFEVYNGKAQPPLSGRVGFYLGGWPDFKPEPGSTIVKGRLGIFPVTWHRSIAQDGSVSQDALLSLDYYWKADIRVTAAGQTDVDQLIAIVSQLPTFTKKPDVIPGNGQTALEYYGGAYGRAATAAFVLFAFLGAFVLTSFKLNRRWRAGGTVLSRRFLLLSASTGLVIVFGSGVGSISVWILMASYKNGITMFQFEVTRGIVLGTAGAGGIEAVALLAFAIAGTVVRIRSRVHA